MLHRGPLVLPDGRARRRGHRAVVCGGGAAHADRIALAAVSVAGGLVVMAVDIGVATMRDIQVTGQALARYGRGVSPRMRLPERWDHASGALLRCLHADRRSARAVRRVAEGASEADRRVAGGRGRLRSVVVAVSSAEQRYRAYGVHHCEPLSARLDDVVRQFAMGTNVPASWLEGAGIAAAGIALGVAVGSLRRHRATRVVVVLAGRRWWVADGSWSSRQEARTSARRRRSQTFRWAPGVPRCELSPRSTSEGSA
jgi:hypothetical protein